MPRAPIGNPRAKASCRVEVALRLPLNVDAYGVLCCGHVPPREAAAALADVRELVPTSRAQRAAARLWGLLVGYEPLLRPSPFTPYLAVAASRIFPSSVIAGLEAAIHWLLNVAAPIMYPSHPRQAEVVAALDGVLEGANVQLHRHLRHHIRSSSSNDIVVTAQTMLLRALGDHSTWVEWMENVVVSSDSIRLYYCSVLAVLLLEAKAILKVHTLRELADIILPSTTPRNVQRRSGEVLRLATSLLPHLEVALEPIVELPRAPVPHYPIPPLNRIRLEPEGQALTLHSIREDEVASMRLRRVEALSQDLRRRLGVEGVEGLGADRPPPCHVVHPPPREVMAPTREVDVVASPQKRDAVAASILSQEIEPPNGSEQADTSLPRVHLTPWLSPNVTRRHVSSV